MMALVNNKFLLPGVLAAVVFVIAGSVAAVIFFSGQNQAARTENPSKFPAPTQKAVRPSPSPAVESLASELILTINSPANESTVASPTLKVSGQTSPLADVTVNGQETKAATTGNFSLTVSLEDGDNYLLITATDQNGNFAEKEIMVTYQDPANNP